MRFPESFEFIRLQHRSKEPVEPNWANTKTDKPAVPSLTPDQVRFILRQGGNYGVRIRPGDLVIDVDPRNGGKLEALPLDLSVYPIVNTPSGGHHIYASLPDGFEYKKIAHSIEQFGKGVEFKIHGQQVVGPGSIHPDFPDGPKYAWDDVFGGEFLEDRAPGIPEEFLAMILKRGETINSASDAAAGMVTVPLFTPEQLGSALARLDVEQFDNNESWFALMCACHDATGGAGREEFVDWSVTDYKYYNHGDAIRVRWDSLTAGRGSNAGVGTLQHILVEHGITDVDFNIDVARAEFAGMDEANAAFTPGDADNPVIRVLGNSLPSNVRDGEAAVGRASLREPGKGLYQRGGMMVCVNRFAGTFNMMDEMGIRRDSGTLQILPVSVDMLRLHLTEAAQWIKFDKRSEEWCAMNAPHDVAKTLWDSIPHWKTMPALHGIAESPIVRGDGSVLQTPGFDEQSGIFFDARIKFDAVPEFPTFEDASRALDLLLEILKGFPFVDESHRSVALAMLLTPFVRQSIRSSPMFLVSAPKQGSGKTLLSNLPSYLSTGRNSSVFSQAENPEEEKKRMLAMLLEGSLSNIIDNVERPLKSDALCSVLTEPSYKDRLLGSTKMVSVPTATVWIATGNNIRVDGDLSSRVLLCGLNPKMEHPEERRFDVNLHQWIPANRGRLAAAAVTILRAYRWASVNGDRVNCTQYGRFEQWSEFVREPLLWLGLDDPCETRAQVEKHDPVRDQLGNLLVNWFERYADSPKPLSAVMTDLESDLEGVLAGLRLAVAAVAMDRGRLNPSRLGNFLNRFEDRIEQGFFFSTSGKTRTGAVLWKANKI